MKLTIILHEIEGEGYLCIKLADLTVLKRNKRFKPPTIEEVRVYCKERKNGIDPEMFIAYYQTRGWELNKGVKMKDWKMAVVTWEKNKTPELKGSNLGESPPENFGVVSKTATQMPESLRKKLSNIGKDEAQD